MSLRTESNQSRSIFSASLRLAILYFIIFAVLGWVSPVVLTILRDFDKAGTWHAGVLAAMHLVWTLPFAIVVALALFWKDRRFPSLIARQINIVSLIVVLVIFAMWLYAVFNRLFALSGHLLEAKLH